MRWRGTERALLLLFSGALACGASAGAPAGPDLDAGAALDGGGAGSDAGGADGGSDAGSERDAGDAQDAGPIGCSWSGAPGVCISVADCAAMTGHTSEADECPGPADIQCCIVTPSTADNPPIPAGYQLMQQSQVTPDMTAWAVAILDDPTDYPMFATTTRVFGSLTVLARVEWHPPDFQNGAIHRGVTLYVPSS